MRVLFFLGYCHHLYKWPSYSLGNKVIRVLLHFINKNKGLYYLVELTCPKMGIQKWRSCGVYVEMHTWFCTCPWKLEKWLLGNLYLLTVFYLMKSLFVNITFTCVHIFRITVINHWGPLLYHFKWLIRVILVTFKRRTMSFLAFGFWQLLTF